VFDFLFIWLKWWKRVSQKKNCIKHIEIAKPIKELERLKIKENNYSKYGFIKL